MATFDIDDYRSWLEIVVNNNNSEIFKIPTIQQYIDFWIKKDKLKECSICNFILKKYKDGNVKVFIKKINKFASEMSQDLIGVLFTWMYMRYIGEGLITKQEALEIDPLSILFHCLIGCCNTQLGIQHNDKQLQKLLLSKIIKKIK